MRQTSLIVSSKPASTIQLNSNLKTQEGWGRGYLELVDLLAWALNPS